jgi:hypothetical protein
MTLSLRIPTQGLERVKQQAVTFEKQSTLKKIDHFYALYSQNLSD